MKILGTTFPPEGAAVEARTGADYSTLSIDGLSLAFSGADRPLASKIAAVVAAHRAGDAAPAGDDAAPLARALDELCVCAAEALDAQSWNEGARAERALREAVRRAEKALDAYGAGSAILAAGGLTGEGA